MHGLASKASEPRILGHFRGAHWQNLGHFGRFFRGTLLFFGALSISALGQTMCPKRQCAPKTAPTKKPAETMAYGSKALWGTFLYISPIEVKRREKVIYSRVYAYARALCPIALSSGQPS